MLLFEPEFTTEETAAIANEYKRVKDYIYLDTAGTMLYPESLLEASTKMLKENLFCNPHTCQIMGDLIDQARYRILKHFNTDATEYAIVFVLNSTAALKAVAENFDFGKDDTNQTGCFYYCQENHTSVLGMREIVRTEDLYVLTKDEMEKNLSNQQQNGGTTNGDKHKATTNSLVVFSAQCNFSGYKMPLETIENIHAHGLIDRGTQIRGTAPAAGKKDESNFYVCLDTASFVASNYLDLKRYKPDFCCISFYKIFGYPTGVGALLVSKRGQAALRKRYYGGGTIDIAMTREDFHAKRPNFTARFEDGTIPFLAIASLLEGFRTLERLIPATPSKLTFQRISTHVFFLAKYCHDLLAELRHANGRPLIKFYNHSGYEDVKKQGGVVTFNILHDNGTFVGYAEVACIAAIYNVHLRTGCFCNPGACQWFLQLPNSEIRKQYDAGHVCSDYNDLVNGLPTGAVRASFGLMTKLEDINKIVSIIRDCYLTTADKRVAILEKAKLPKSLQHVPQRLQPKLRRICVYPIKSCGAFDVTDKWELTDCGLKYDRSWMIIDVNGVAVTQKHFSRLCLIRPVIHADEGVLEITFPNMKSVKVPLEMPAGRGSRVESTFCQSKVCNDLVEGLDCGDEVADWLSDCLETSGLRLLRQNVERRSLDGAAKSISLVNQGQFLLVNSTSVHWLANKVDSDKEPLENTIDRFRANLIIESPEAFEENQFEELSVGGVEFKVDGFCTRCQMICIDQHNGQKTPEPLRTIAKEFQGKIRFGIYLSLKNTLNAHTIISCKDEVKVQRKQ